MAEKKIDDVKRPDKVTPSASGRPIIVTNRPVLTADPMVVPKADSSTAEAVPVTRTAKTIAPVSQDVEAPAEKTKAPEAPTPAETTESAEPSPDTPAEQPEAEAAENTRGVQIDTPVRDSEAAVTAAEAEAEAARQARETELEQLIASGKYAVPVNSVERKRTVHTSVGLTVLVVVLAALLIDLMLDANIIELLQKLPHTHFFTAK